MNLPTQISAAHLPDSYEAAKVALAECARVDECQDWADRAAALASYARQSEDATLEAYAKRIRARAIRRAGELLKQVEPQAGARSDLGSWASIGSRKAIATEAGMSERQAKTMPINDRRAER